MVVTVLQLEDKRFFYRCARYTKFCHAYTASGMISTPVGIDGFPIGHSETRSGEIEEGKASDVRMQLALLYDHTYNE